jgi:hypothetical protein
MDVKGLRLDISGLRGPASYSAGGEGLIGVAGYWLLIGPYANEDGVEMMPWEACD